MRKGLVSPQKKILLPHGNRSSKLTVTAQTLPIRSSQKSVGCSCHGSLENSKEHLAVSAWPAHTVSLQRFKTPLKTFCLNRQASYIYNSVLTTATESLNILHRLLENEKNPWWRHCFINNVCHVHSPHTQCCHLQCVGRECKKSAKNKQWIINDFDRSSALRGISPSNHSERQLGFLAGTT